MTQRTLAIGYGSLLWSNVGITFVRAKGLHLHNSIMIIIIIIATIITTAGKNILKNRNTFTTKSSKLA